MTQEIQQSQVDMAADDLLSRGVRPTLLKVQQLIGGDRPALIGFLEDWARRLHSRVAGRDGEPLVDSSDKAAMEKADLDVMREADSIRKSMLRNHQLQRRNVNDEKDGRDSNAARRKELLKESERLEHRLRNEKARAQEIKLALGVTEGNIATWKARLKGIEEKIQALPQPT